MGAQFYWVEQSRPHATVLAELTSSTPGTVVFLDPDLVFWQEVQGWDFGDALAAGRFIPQFDDPFSGCVTEARLHTSFLWLQNTRRLLERVGELRRKHIDFDPFAPYSFSDNGRWRRLDTGASLFAACPDEMHSFSEGQLDSYDHLFCGSHLPRVAPHLPGEVAAAWAEAHAHAKSGNLQALRGIHKKQEALFKSR